jgi:hypothetical protein
MIKRSKELFVLIFILMISATAPASTGTVNTAFSINMNLFAIVTVTKVQDLTFPQATLTGSAFTIIVNTGDSGAATFNATGTNSRSITKSIVQSSINMSASGVAGTIAVDTFILAGPTAFDGSGNANGIKVGATAHVLATSLDGNYTGTATLRVVYQ